MSELKRRTPEEVELWYLGKIASMTVEIMDLKAHAVEVLAKQISRTYRADSTSTYKYMRDKHRFIMDQESWDNKCRAEARELLGIDKEKEGDND